MKKILLIILSLLLFFPLTMHSSGAYLTDAKTIPVTISAAEDSPFFLIELSSQGAQSFTPPISSGSNSTFCVNWYGSYPTNWVTIGTVIPHVPGVRIRINFVVAEGSKFFDIKEINNITGPAKLEIRRRGQSLAGVTQLTVNYTVYDNQGVVLLTGSFPIYVHP